MPYSVMPACKKLQHLEHHHTGNSVTDILSSIEYDRLGILNPRITKGNGMNISTTICTILFLLHTTALIILHIHSQTTGVTLCGYFTIPWNLGFYQVSDTADNYHIVVEYYLTLHRTLLLAGSGHWKSFKTRHLSFPIKGKFLGNM